MKMMRLEGQNFAELKAPTDAQIRRRVLALQSAGRHSYASLTREDGSYVQVAGGRSTCMVERFDSATVKRERAFHDKPHPFFPDGTQLVFAAGTLTLKSDEWFLADAVVEIFLCFKDGRQYPDAVSWRPAPGF